MKKYLSIIGILIVLLSFSMTTYATDPDNCPHNYLPKYKKIDNDLHSVEYKCEYCGALDYSYTEGHYTVPTGKYKKIDNDLHSVEYKCEYCGALDYSNTSWHCSDGSYTYKAKNNGAHITTYKCVDCGTVVSREESHTESVDYTCKKIDDNLHGRLAVCDYCGYKHYEDISQHSWLNSNIVKPATVFEPGIIQYKCSFCSAEKVEPFQWKAGAYGSESYSISEWSDVYKKSKSMHVFLTKPVPGGILQVKIGKKVYRVPADQASITIKFKKKPKNFQDIEINLLYGPMCLDTKYDFVIYAKRVKKGMTKRQVEYTWGDPDDTSKSSGGWTFWYYNDGSYVGFKGKRVKIWYNADP